jgi:predicted metal-dependent hydrolase
MNSVQKHNQDSPDSAGATLQTALKMFNGGDYFACHELLEVLWLDEHDPQRELYKGILQIGIGLLHLQRGNVSGARRLLLNGSRLIEPFTPSLFGIDLITLQSDARSVLRRLEEPNRTHSFLPEDAIQIQTL